MQEVVSGPRQGKFTTTHLRRIQYGPDCIEGLWEVLQDVMAEYAGNGEEGQAPKVLIMTGNSLSKTPVVPRIEQLLKDRQAFTSTFTGMKQHAPIANIEEALNTLRDNGANCIVAIGGGSVIDAAKLVSYFHNERHGTFIPHIAVPTTLSAAEFTSHAGYTDKEGNKNALTGEGIVPKAIIMDPKLSIYTPEKLWLSTGIRAIDHAFETLYRPGAAYPLQQTALAAIRDLFAYLPQCMGEDGKEQIEARGKLQIAAWMSLFPSKIETGLGPSHALGHALGARYAIPHGYCSVLTLPNTLRMMARNMPEGNARSMLANAFSYIPTSYVRDHMYLSDESEGEPDVGTILAAAAALDRLIDRLGLRTNLKAYKVPKEDLDKVAERAYIATSGKPGWKGLCPSAELMVKQVLEPAY